MEAAVKRILPDASPSGLLERTLGVLELLSTMRRHAVVRDRERLANSAQRHHRVLTSLASTAMSVRSGSRGLSTDGQNCVSAFTFLTGSGITDFAQRSWTESHVSAAKLVRLAMVDGRTCLGRQSAGFPAGPAL